jgi:hypothetical protein
MRKRDNVRGLLFRRLLFELLLLRNRLSVLWRGMSKRFRHVRWRCTSRVFVGPNSCSELFVNRAQLFAHIFVLEYSDSYADSHSHTVADSDSFSIVNGASGPDQCKQERAVWG